MNFTFKDIPMHTRHIRILYCKTVFEFEEHGRETYLMDARQSSSAARSFNRLQPVYRADIGLSLQEAIKEIRATQEF